MKLIVFLSVFSLEAVACDWIYQPAYQTRLAYLQNSISYGRAQWEFQVDRMNRKRMAEAIASQKEYQSLNQYSRLQISLVNDMVEDAYLYQPNRDEYKDYKFREVSSDFAREWVRICKDRLWE